MCAIEAALCDVRACKQPIHIEKREYIEYAQHTQEVSEMCSYTSIGVQPNYVACILQTSQAGLNAFLIFMIKCQNTYFLRKYMDSY